MGDRVDRFAFDSMQHATADKTAVDLLGSKSRTTKDDVHNMLMVAGFTPGLGNIADAADALLYAAQGEFGNAGVSVASMIPFVGQTVAAKKAVVIPIMVITVRANGEYSYIGEHLTIRNTPAVTIVAA